MHLVKSHVASKHAVQAATISTRQRVFCLPAFPNEILLTILDTLDISTLLSLCNTNKRFQTLAYIILAKRLLGDSSFRVRLFFDQENRWRFNVDLKLTSADPKTGQFIFTPVNPATVQVFYSPMLCSPTLRKITIVGDGVGVDPKGNDNILVSVTDAKENFLPKPKGLNVKAFGAQRNRYILRRSSSVCATIPYYLSYNVSPIPITIKQTRSGERRLTSLAFECPLVFFYSQSSITSKVSKVFKWIIPRGGLGSYLSGIKQSRGGNPPGDENKPNKAIKVSVL